MADTAKQLADIRADILKAVELIAPSDATETDDEGKPRRKPRDQGLSTILRALESISNSLNGGDPYDNVWEDYDLPARAHGLKQTLGSFEDAAYKAWELVIPAQEETGLRPRTRQSPLQRLEGDVLGGLEAISKDTMENVVNQSSWYDETMAGRVHLMAEALKSKGKPAKPGTVCSTCGCHQET